MTTPVDVVGRVSSVLRGVATAEPGGATTSALARATGLARPTAHRLLTSLQRDGLLDRDPATGSWLLGPELYLLGAAAAPRYDVTSLAQPFVRRLSQATGESAFFSARRGDETVCLLREDGSFPVRSHVLHEGIRFPLGVASAGLAILAFLPADEQEDVLARVAVEPYGNTHQAHQIRARVAETRRTGWSLNPGLIVTGSWGMGAAVFDASGRPAWALSLTGVDHRFAAERQPELGAALLQNAHALTRSLAKPQPNRASATVTER